MRMRSLSFLAAGALFVAAPPAQVSRNVDLLAIWRSPTNPPASAYNDVWGYHDPDTHRELAIVGSTEGLHFVDCTDPRNPVELKSFLTPVRGNNNIWRDMRTYGHHLYEVSEAYGGTRIFGLKAQVPVLKAWWGQNRWTHAHNLGMDPVTGIGFAAGTNRGVVLFDCSVDPVNPTWRSDWRDTYIHDCTAADGYGYFAASSANELIILDVSNPSSPQTLSRTRAPGSSICHNAWPSRDGTICVTTNEAQNGPVGVFDIRNKFAPRLLATYRTYPTVTPSPHNAYIRERVAHMSYYSEGYRAVDLSDPSQPVEVGFYDTLVGGNGGFGAEGAWGCYHAQPSGVIYASDIQGGLFVLKPKATSARYGDATAGNGGGAPEIHAFGAAFKGNANFALELERARPSSQAAFFLSPMRQTVSLQGLAINVDLGPGLIAIGATTDAAGKARLPLPISTTITPGTWYVQALIVDPASASPLGLAATQGMEMEIFPL